MDIFILIQQSDHEKLKQYIKQNPEAVVDAKYTFYGKHKSQNCELSPLEYAVLMQDAKAFGIIFQSMKNLLGFEFHPLPEFFQKVFYYSFNEVQYIHVAKFNLDSSSYNPINFLKAIPNNIPNYNAFMQKVFGLLCNGNHMSHEVYKMNKIKTLKLIQWMIQNIRIIVIDIHYSSFVINTSKYNVSGNALSPDEACMLNAQLLKKAFEKEFIKQVQFAPFLETALISNDIETIKTCIAADVDITQKNNKGFSLIHQLAMYGSPSVSEPLIEKIVEIYGGVPSVLANHFAVIHLIFERRNLFMLEFFVDRGFNLFSLYSEYGKTTFADKLIEDIKYNKIYRFSIIDTFENLNLLYEPRIWKTYSLRSAIERKDWEIVRILLKIKRDPFEPDDSGLSPADIYQMSKPHFNRDTLKEVQDLDKVFTRDLDLTKEYIQSKIKSALKEDYEASCQGTQKEADELAAFDKENFNLASKYCAFMKKYHIVFRQPDPIKPAKIEKTGEKIKSAKTVKIGKIGESEIKVKVERIGESEKPLKTEKTEKTVKTEKNIVKENPVEALIKIYQAHNSIQWHDLKLIPVYLNFIRKIVSCCKNPLLLRFQQISFQVDIFEFNLNAFFDISDPLRPFFDDDHFLKCLNALIAAMCGKGEVDLRQWATMPFYQNTVNRKALLWSISAKQRKGYLAKGLKASGFMNQVANNVANKFADKFSDKLADKFVHTKTISIGKFTFKMNDFTKMEEYSFLVHTTSGDPKNLEAILYSTSNFINETPFFSASLVDSSTPFAKMMHQHKIIFPLSLVLDVEDDAVIKAYPKDAWSPQFSSFKTKKEFLENASKFLRTINILNQHFSYHEYFVRTLTRPSISQNLDWDAEAVYRTLQKDPEYDPGSFDDQNEPRIPEISPLLALNKTHQYYNEIIVAGRRKNKIVAIMIEEADLKTFIEEYPKLKDDALKLANESLAILSKSTLPFIIVRTKLEAQLLDKLTERERRLRVSDEFSKSLAATSDLLLKQYRLLNARKNNHYDHAGTLSGSAREALLISLDKQLQESFEKLKQIRSKSVRI